MVTLRDLPAFREDYSKPVKGLILTGLGLAAVTGFMLEVGFVLFGPATLLAGQIPTTGWGKLLFALSWIGFLSSVLVFCGFAAASRADRKKRQSLQNKTDWSGIFIPLEEQTESW